MTMGLGLTVMYWGITYFGVFLFWALTVYDMQKLK
jgi:FtsH-binding integral membrane protein